MLGVRSQAGRDRNGESAGFHSSLVAAAFLPRPWESCAFSAREAKTAKRQNRAVSAVSQQTRIMFDARHAMHAHTHTQALPGCFSRDSHARQTQQWRTDLHTDLRLISSCSRVLERHVQLPLFYPLDSADLVPCFVPWILPSKLL